MSRRDKIRMTDDELREFVASAHTIIINSIGKDGVPHPMPMWFGVEDDGAVVMSTFTKSQKIKNLERDPRVSLLVEDGTEYSELRGAVLYGTAELVPEVDDVVEEQQQESVASSPRPAKWPRCTRARRPGIADTESRQAILRPTVANPGEQESHGSR